MDCLEQLANFQEWTGSQIVQQSFFINATDNSTYLAYHRMIMDELGRSGDLPSTSIVAQPPAAGHELSMELVMISHLSPDMRISYTSEKGVHYTILSSATRKEIYAGGITPVDPEAPFVQQVEKAYHLLESILHREEMEFANIARQWNYVQEILSIHDIGEERMQNYQVLNDIRSQYYAKSEFIHGYPAATGIGMNAGGILLEIYALKPHEAMEILPVKNPKQVDAYQYSDKVLVGDSLDHTHRKTTPKFERAKYVGQNGAGTIFISGTASIQNEMTIGEADVKKQSEVTIENISNLIASSNLVRAGLKRSPEKMDYTFIRVYIKNGKDFELVKNICDTYYGDIPLHYLLADVCRDNLLLEIEGVVIVS